jgi:hypothetical protein
MKRLSLLISLLILPALACSTFNRLAEGGNLTDLATPPAANDGPTVTEPETLPAGDAFVLPSGLTISSPRETRITLTEENLEAFEDRADETENYTDEEYNTVGNTLTFTLSAQADERLAWYYGWCATTPELLEDNLAKMKIEFIVEDTVVPANQFETFDSVQISTDGTEVICHTYAAMVSKWPGGLNTLVTRITFLEAVNDGMGDYDAGTITFKYEILGN